MKYILLILFLLYGCGADSTKVNIEKRSNEVFTKGRFLISTAESLISSYNVVLKFNLYTLITNLDELGPSPESFEAINEALEHASRFEPYNVAVLVKDDSCVAPIGYCKAVLISKNL